MEDRIDKIKNKIDRYRWHSIWVDVDSTAKQLKVLDRGTPTKKSLALAKEMKARFKENSGRFGDKLIAEIRVNCYPENLNTKSDDNWKKTVLSIFVEYFRLLPDGSIGKIVGKHFWAFAVNFIPADLEKKDITIDLIRKIVMLGKSNKINTGIAGIQYSALMNKLKKIRDRKKK